MVEYGKQSNNSSIASLQRRVTDVVAPPATCIPATSRVSTHSTDGPLDVVSLDDESVNEIEPLLPHFSFNLARYANDNQVIKNLVDLGVSVWKFDRDSEVSQLLLRLDWERDVEPYLDFLQNVGIEREVQAKIIGLNPRVLKEKLCDLESKRDYFITKLFQPTDLAPMFVESPLLLSMSVRQIDDKLGWLQKKFRLTGNEIRDLISRRSWLITKNRHQMELTHLGLRCECGFTGQEEKAILMRHPRVMLTERQTVVAAFDYLHRKVGYSHVLLSKQPEALEAWVSRLEPRHLFLRRLKLDQFDPTKPLYVSPSNLAATTSEQFCADVARVPLSTYTRFLKTL